MDTAAIHPAFHAVLETCLQQMERGGEQGAIAA